MTLGSNSNHRHGSRNLAIKLKSGRKYWFRRFSILRRLALIRAFGIVWTHQVFTTRLFWLSWIKASTFWTKRRRYRHLNQIWVFIWIPSKIFSINGPQAAPSPRNLSNQNAKTQTARKTIYIFKGLRAERSRGGCSWIQRVGVIYRQWTGIIIV